METPHGPSPHAPTRAQPTSLHSKTDTDGRMMHSIDGTGPRSDMHCRLCKWYPIDAVVIPASLEISACAFFLPRRPTGFTLMAPPTNCRILLSLILSKLAALLPSQPPAPPSLSLLRSSARSHFLRSFSSSITSSSAADAWPSPGTTCQDGCRRSLPAARGRVVGERALDARRLQRPPAMTRRHVRTCTKRLTSRR